MASSTSHARAQSFVYTPPYPTYHPTPCTPPPVPVPVPVPLPTPTQNKRSRRTARALLALAIILLALATIAHEARPFLYVRDRVGPEVILGAAIAAGAVEVLPLISKGCRYAWRGYRRYKAGNGGGEKAGGIKAVTSQKPPYGRVYASMAVHFLVLAALVVAGIFFLINTEPVLLDGSTLEIWACKVTPSTSSGPRKHSGTPHVRKVCRDGKVAFATLCGLVVMEVGVLGLGVVEVRRVRMGRERGDIA